ncbi:hypothetical protein NKG94_28915 [Micromonospora sp. M12]
MASARNDSTRSGVWAWPVGILIGLAIGIPVFGAKGGVAFGVALGIALALAFGASRSRADGEPTQGGAESRAAGDGVDSSAQR